MKCFLFVCAAAVALLSMGSTTLGSFISPIPTLYNTGVASTGGLLSDNTTDSHYVVHSFTPDIGQSLAPGSTMQAVTGTTPWTGTNSGALGAASKWISVNGFNTTLQTDIDPSGTYTIRTTFTLPSFVAGTAGFVGNFASDNQLNGILLNGNSLTGIGGVPSDPFGWRTFAANGTLNNFFQAGLNTLDFIVVNGSNNNGNTQPPNPMGLRVAFSSSSVMAVPEPATVALWGMGAVGLAAFRFRRRR
jgi:hypothetical protein